MALVLLMVASLIGSISATPEKAPYLVGQCTSAPTAINMLSYTVNDNQTACPNLNVSVHWNITVNVTSPSAGSFNASVPAGLCSLGLSVYTNDFLAISGTTGHITIVYIPPTAGLVTTVQIAYAANGIYLRSSDQLTLYSNGPLPSYPLWDIYGVTSTTLCQLMGSQLIEPLINLKPFDNNNPTCDATTLLRPQSTGIRLTSLSLPLVPGNYTLLLTNGMCTSPNLLTSPPLYLTVLPSNSMPSTVVVQPTTIPSPGVNKGAIVGAILGGLVAILVAVLIIVVVVVVVVVVAKMRKRKSVDFESQEVPLPVVSTIAVLGVKITPWLGSFSATLASCDHATLLSPEETCTVQVLSERLAQCSRVYLVLNGPSDELVTTLRDSELPENALSKLVVVELRDTVLTDRSHPNVKWIPPLPEVQPSTHEEYARLVHGYCSSEPPPSHLGVAQQDPPPTVTTSALVLTSGESSRGSPMAEPAELTQLHNVLNKIADDLKDVKHGVNTIVDRHQEESVADIPVL